MADSLCDYCGGEAHDPCPDYQWDLQMWEAIRVGVTIGRPFSAPCGCGLAKTPVGGWMHMKCLSAGLDLGHDRQDDKSTN